MDTIATTPASAMVTTDIRIGGLTVGDGFHNPVMLARAFAGFDVMSGGQFEVDHGSGTYPMDDDRPGIS